MKATLLKTTILAASILLATGCAGLAPKPTGEQETASNKAAAVKKNGARIDVPDIIEAADEAGCILGAVIYEEGRRSSNLGLYCEGNDLPVPARFNNSK